MLRPLENIGRSGTKRTLELVRDTTPASKIDDEHHPRANIAAAGTPGFILDGHGHAPGVSWALLGRSWARLGRSWAPPGRFFATSWALLGVFWLVPGASWMHLCVQRRPRPLFQEVWRLAAPRGHFSHAGFCTSHVALNGGIAGGCRAMKFQAAALVTL